jgi:hypothetical protein
MKALFLKWLSDVFWLAGADKASLICLLRSYSYDANVSGPECDVKPRVQTLNVEPGVVWEDKELLAELEFKAPTANNVSLFGEATTPAEFN